MLFPQEKHYTAEDYFNPPENAHIELINGQFYNMAVPSLLHQAILRELSFAISSYFKKEKGNCQFYPSPFAVQLSKENDTIVEPDISVICEPTKLTKYGCIGAPDWIIEIASPSNPKHDFVTKFALYTEAGVREYWIIDQMHKRINVYNFEESTFIINVYTFDDTVKVEIYDDFYINFADFDLEMV